MKEVSRDQSGQGEMVDKMIRTLTALTTRSWTKGRQKRKQSLPKARFLMLDGAAA
jgi:hypothetical protein